MSTREIIGQYVVDLGANLKLKQDCIKRKYHIGYDRSLIPGEWYVVFIQTGAIMGHYEDFIVARHLAVGLDKRDQKNLASEMEKVLIEE